MIAYPSLPAEARRPLIIIVDDDQAVRDSLKFALELDGLDVDTCDSGEELLRHPHLALARCLVLDYKMPEMNGFSLIAELKRRKVTLPVILITAPLSREIERLAIEAGIAGVLEKPLLENVLVDKIRHLL